MISIGLMSKITRSLSTGNTDDLLKISGEILLKDGIKSVIIHTDSNGAIKFSSFKTNVHEDLTNEINRLKLALREIRDNYTLTKK